MPMPRVARVVIADVAHHITQRGNGRQFILASDSDRMVFMDLLRQAVEGRELSLVGYCLMSNHLHLVVVPHRAEDLAPALQKVLGRYASYWNVAHTTCGHVWQGRFYSCPMDPGHLWTALRYVELNPVRAKMAGEAAAWPWSSAAAHCGMADPHASLNMSLWRKSWAADTWRKFLGEGESASDLRALRQSTRTGRPWGSKEFTSALEAQTHRRLLPGPPGRPRKKPAELNRLAPAA
jgi:putative transposase